MRCMGRRRVEGFDGDDHALTGSSGEAEKLIGRFVMRCAKIGVKDGAEVLVKKLVGEKEKVELLEKSGDLRGQESVH